MSKLLLFSGGQDSIALAHTIRPALLLTIDYGQVCAEAEVRASSAAAEAMGLRHRVLRADCSAVGSGDLAGRPPSSVAPASEWWPFRNQLLITLGAAVALAEGLKSLVVGSVANDDGHADGRVEFFTAIAAALRVQEGALELTAPALGLSTVELIRKSGVPTEVLAWAHSCHTSNWACGKCRGCNKHWEVLNELGGQVY